MPGSGGLAASIHLAAAGHDVLVLERLDRAGGKLAEHTAAGFTWETGPSLLTLPQVFRDLAAVAGRSLDDLVTLRRLDPICRYRFADGTTFDHRAELDDAAAAAEALSPGSGAEWRAFMAQARRVWEVSERSFFAGAMSSPLELLGRMQSPRDLLAIDPLRSLHAAPRHRSPTPDWCSTSTATPPTPGRRRSARRRPSRASPTSSSRSAPGTSMVASVGWRTPSWRWPRGPASRSARAVDVDRIERRGGAAAGVRLTSGEVVAADAVVANVDALHLYRDLLPHPRRRRRAEAAPRSSSGFVLLLGLDGATPGLAHHNISFSADYEAEFDQLFRSKEPASDPTVYVCAASITDPGQAPEGQEGWFVLVNVPEGGGAMDGYGDHVLEVLARRGSDLSGRIVHREQITPADIESRYRTPGGAIYGTSSNGRMAAFLRPGNRGPLDRLYLCGGSSHPGGGLPLVAMSGGIAAGLCLADLGAL